MVCLESLIATLQNTGKIDSKTPVPLLSGVDENGLSQGRLRQRLSVRREFEAKIVGETITFSGLMRELTAKMGVLLVSIG